MSKILFGREIVRGVVLGVHLVCVMFLGVAIYHWSISQKAAAAHSELPATVVTAVEAPNEEAPSQIEAPPAELDTQVVAPSGPPVGKRSPAKDVRLVTAAIHDEEAAASEAPAESTAPEAPAAGVAAPQEAPPQESIVEPLKPAQENRGVRWIRSIGRRLRIGGR